MAFHGTFLSKIKGISHGTLSTSSMSNPNTQQQPTIFVQEDDYDNSKPKDNNSHEYTAAHHAGVLDTDLTSLTTTQKNIFIVVLTILFMLSICGNMGTLFVNFRRKMRPFFRVCLISLALSDLMNTVFLTTAYFSQFTAEFVQIWRLGDFMCSLVPFATTIAILASSMTLVGIAVDRYFAVMKAINGFWNPSLISCIACALCIWLVSIGIACPVFTIYDVMSVYILTEEHETATNSPTHIASATATNVIVTNTGAVIMASKKPTINAAIRLPPMLPLTKVIATENNLSWQKEASLGNLSYTLVREQQLVSMCVSDQKNVTLYYVIVFVIIFIPCLGAFFWFNSIIARKLWKRRHVAAISKKETWKNKNKRQTPYPDSKNPRCDVSKLCVQPVKNCNCKTGHTTSTTVPSSLINTLGGKVTISAATTAIPTNVSNSNNNSNVTTNSSREARHLRMFTIILLMMAVFVFLRLPAWIFLLMRLYGNYTKPVDWIIYFLFGLMNLTSSVLNPLFYTFLTETIHYTLKVKAKVKTLICGCYGQVDCCSKNNDDSSASNGFLRNIFCCQVKNQYHQSSSNNQLSYPEHEIQSKNSSQVANNDKDEGVDCNDDADDEGIQDFYEFNPTVYTIFPPSLVSSSLNSQTC